MAGGERHGYHSLQLRSNHDFASAFVCSPWSEWTSMFLAPMQAPLINLQCDSVLCKGSRDISFWLHRSPDLASFAFHFLPRLSEGSTLAAAVGRCLSWRSLFRPRPLLPPSSWPIDPFSDPVWTRLAGVGGRIHPPFLLAMTKQSAGVRRQSPGRKQKRAVDERVRVPSIDKRMTRFSLFIAPLPTTGVKSCREALR